MNATDHSAGSDMAGTERPLEWPEVIFILVFLAIAAISWIGTLLAEIGAFRGVTVLAGSILLTGISWWLAIREIGARPVRLSRPSSLSLASLVVTVAVSAALFARPGEYVFEGYDASVYLAVGRTIETSGGIVAPDPLLKGLPADAREKLFLRDPNWPHLLNRFPGGMQIAEGRDDIVPSFFHLLPVWIAILNTIAGPRAGFFVNSAAGVLAVLALWLLGRRLSSPIAGAVAAGLLMVNFGEIWCARIQLSEILAQFLLLAGLYFSVLAFDRHLRTAGWAAGVAFGLSALARIDGLFMMPLAMTIVALMWRQRGFGPPWGWFLGGVIVFGGHAVAHALIVSTPYTLRLITTAARSAMSVASNIQGIAAVGVFAVLILVGAGATLATRGRWTSPTRWKGATGCLLVVALPLGFLAPGVARPIIDLLSPLGIASAAAGLAVLVSRQPGPRTWLITTIFAAQWVVFFVWHETTTLPEDFRRYVPVVLPLTMLFTGCLVSFLATSRSVLRHTVWAVPVWLGAIFVMRSAPIISTAPMRDAYTALESVAGRMPPESVVLSDRTAPSHLSMALQYHLGRRAMRVAEREGLRSGVHTLFDRALVDGRAVYVLIGRYEGEVPRRLWRADLADFDVSPVEVLPLRYTIVAPTRSTFPSEMREVSDRLELCRVSHRRTAAERPVPAVVDLGDRDFPYVLHGFFGPESILGSSARWTTDEADVWLPPIAIPQSTDATLSLRAFAYRPPHIAAPTIDLSIDGIAVGRITNPSAEFGTYRVVLVPAVSARLRQGPTVLTIRCIPFSPKAAGISDDGRLLGIAVDLVTIE